jgi:hypothetical protein
MNWAQWAARLQGFAARFAGHIKKLTPNSTSTTYMSQRICWAFPVSNLTRT